MPSRRRSCPGERYRVQLKLNDVGQAVPAGHRLRLALTQRLLADDLAVAAGNGDAAYQARAGSSCRCGRRATRTTESAAVRAAGGQPAAARRSPSGRLARAPRRGRPDRRAADRRVVQGPRRRADRRERHRDRQRRARDLRDRGRRSAFGAGGNALAQPARRAATGASARRSTTVQTATERPFSSPPASTPMRARRAFSAARGRSKFRAISSEPRNGQPAGTHFGERLAGATLLIWNRIAATTRRLLGRLINGGFQWILG